MLCSCVQAECGRIEHFDTVEVPHLHRVDRDPCANYATRDHATLNSARLAYDNYDSVHSYQGGNAVDLDRKSFAGETLVSSRCEEGSTIMLSRSQFRRGQIMASTAGREKEPWSGCTEPEPAMGSH